MRLPQGIRSLSARLLVLTVFFVMVSEVLIFAPSVGRYRLMWLDAKIAAGHLAMLALEATPDNMVTQELANELLAHVGAHGVVLHKPNNTRLMIDEDMPPEIQATVDLRDVRFFGAIMAGLGTLLREEPRVIRVLNVSPRDPRAVVEVVVEEQPLREAMIDFGLRIVQLSLLISLVTAALVYLSLQWLLVRPMRGIVAAMMAFREDPEDASRVIRPSRRSDEIGVAQRELAGMQETVRQALSQRARLAALGTAVTKINHDLRNILATARLLSDSLADSAAPEVRRVAPNLLAALDRAVALCTRTLDFTREETPPLQLRRFVLAALIDEVRLALGLPQPDGATLRTDLPQGLEITADRDQLYRALFNICRNAVEAGGHHLFVRGVRQPDAIAVDIMDDGPGLPPKARDNLFRPFAGSARPGGTGLGLAIAREVARAHGGELQLVSSTAEGTHFRLRLPTRGEARQHRSAA